MTQNHLTKKAQRPPDRPDVGINGMGERISSSTVRITNTTERVGQTARGQQQGTNPRIPSRATLTTPQQQPQAQERRNTTGTGQGPARRVNTRQIPGQQPDRRPVRRDMRNLPPSRTSYTSYAPQPESPKMSRRGWLKVALGAVVAVTIPSLFVARSSLQMNVNDRQSPGYRGLTLELVCGHNHDSQQKKTQIHIWIEGQRIHFIETPAGDETKAKLTVGRDLISNKDFNPDTNAILSPQIERLADGHLLLTLTIEGGPIDVWGKRDVGTAHYLDNGQYFIQQQY